ncbi:MAG: acyl-CoA thioesterase [Spirochaetales bacterium]|nr:acyl-CoA thioesterase [Spirochaetales bacterium]
MFTYHRKAQYHETDKMSIIHHSNYVKWMEETRVAFMDRLGYSFRRMEETGIASPVVGITVDYKKPVEFDDDVEVRLSILKYSGAVLELGYEFFNVTKGEVCTTATSKHCFVKDGRIVSLKKVLPEFDGILASYNA